MEQDNLIYVAGNPDLYPLEYYDPDTGEYAGAIPEMLKSFAGASGYEIVYYQPGPEDRRDELAGNQQVDLISGCLAAEGERPYANTIRRIDLYETQLDGETAAYSLFCTNVAPDAFQKALTAYFGSLSRAALGGEVAAALEQPPPSPSLLPAVAGLGAAVLLLAAAAGVIYRRGRKRLQAVLRRLRVGPYNMLTEQGLADRFGAFVNDNNRVLYQLFYFRFAMDKIACLGGKEAPDAFSQTAASAIRNSLGTRDLAVRLGNGDMAVLKYAENALPAGEWGRKLQRQLQNTPTCGGPFRPDTVSLGVYPLRRGDHTLPDALYYARRCALAASGTEEGMLVGDEAHYRLWDEERQLLLDFSPALAQGELQIWIQFLVSAPRDRRRGGLHPLETRPPGGTQPGAVYPAAGTGRADLGAGLRLPGADLRFVGAAGPGGAGGALLLLQRLPFDLFQAPVRRPLPGSRRPVPFPHLQPGAGGDGKLYADPQSGGNHAGKYRRPPGQGHPDHV